MTPNNLKKKIDRRRIQYDLGKYIALSPLALKR